MRRKYEFVFRTATNRKKLLGLWAFGCLPSVISLGHLQKCPPRMRGGVSFDQMAAGGEGPQMGADDRVGAGGAGRERIHPTQDKGEFIECIAKGQGQDSRGDTVPREAVGRGCI